MPDPTDAGGLPTWLVRMVGADDARDVCTALDWDAHPLGPPSGWPAPLRSAVGTCLASRHPMVVWWSAELFMLYNRAYARVLGVPHPEAFAAPAARVRPYLWTGSAAPTPGAILTGRPATWVENHQVSICLLYTSPSPRDS